MNNYFETSKKYKGFHYSVLSHEALDYLHKRTLEIFTQIKEIFDANGIKYMICGGTLLGASTTGSFIPWDDDFDMCVFEEDYERAINLLIEKMSDDIIVQYKKVEPRYFHGWVKVRDKNSKVEPATQNYANNGVWCDIYKLAKLKKKDIPYKIAKEHLAYLKRRLGAHDITKSEYKKRVKQNCLYGRLFKAKISSLFSSKNSIKYIIWSASKIVLDESWVLPLSKTVFEEIEVTTFAKPECYLTEHYGNDYKTLPPEEKRRVGINSVQIFSGGGTQV
ncbi:MAG: LicD family protein [Treponema sp.]|nr:LicD family protein [Treponema sp.]